jgi:flavodoxin I
MLYTVTMAALVGTASAYSMGVMPAASAMRATNAQMSVGLLYSTTTGNTEAVAGYIAEATGLEATDIGDVDGSTVAGFDGLILGAPTWHTGADTERSGTAWDDFLYGDLTGLDLKGKKVAVFGVGDQSGYADNFCDAMDELASCFKKQGAEIIGSWPLDGYDHEESKSIDGGKFIGLACDEDNQPDLSEERVATWISQIKGEGMPL